MGLLPWLRQSGPRADAHVLVVQRAPARSKCDLFLCDVISYMLCYVCVFSFIICSLVHFVLIYVYCYVCVCPEQARLVRGGVELMHQPTPNGLAEQLANWLDHQTVKLE